MPPMSVSLDSDLLGLLVRNTGFLTGNHTTDAPKLVAALKAEKVDPKLAAAFMARLRLSPQSEMVRWDGLVKPRFDTSAMADLVDHAEQVLANGPWAKAFKTWVDQFGINGGVAIEGLVREVAAVVIDVGALMMVSEPVRQDDIVSVPVAEPSLNTPYVNTITIDQQVAYPAGLEEDMVFENAVRWNAGMIVDSANRKNHGLGGHIGTFQSAATLYEVLQNHFLTKNDHIYVQGHSSPGIYARGYLEGQITKEQLQHFRREVDGQGLPSYPHPWRLPNFWNNATVSMGLGPIGAIMQARFNRYLETRGIKDTSKQKIWAFLGDGEMDEPESRGALQTASRDKLDNLIFVVNCNLQRLDSPVRPNGSIIQELESSFKGNGWNVIKVVWGSKWDPLFAQDKDGALLKRVSEITDGQWQNYGAWNIEKVRADFIGENEELRNLFQNYSDVQFIEVMNDRGGHDPRKVYAAYKLAQETNGKPTVILAQSIKGRGMESKQAALGNHNEKTYKDVDLPKVKNHLGIPLDVPTDPDELTKWDPFYTPPQEILDHAKARREALGGSYFTGGKPNEEKLTVPVNSIVAKVGDKSSGGNVPMEEYLKRLFYFLDTEELPEGVVPGQLRSTTKVYLSVMQALLSNPEIKNRIVPILPDEGRTFGWDALFQNPGVWDALLQSYLDRQSGGFMNYRTGPKGQVMQEGINEAGAMATFIAAATAHRSQGLPMIPFYIYYSMFGLQRTMDQWWQNADMRGRGFLVGATFGRTTLHGEGTQHQDGHSLLLASTIPQLRSYEPAFAYEMAMIVEEGINEMYGKGRDVFYYMTSHNEDYLHPDLPADAKEQARIRQGVKKGMYLFHNNAGKGEEVKADLFASGSIMMGALKAQNILKEVYNIATNIWSVTSYSELAKEADAVSRWNNLNPEKPAKVSYLERQLDHDRTIVAVSDSIKAVPRQIEHWVKGKLNVLGTDGMGLSDTRKKLRDHFEIAANYIVFQTLVSLFQKGEFKCDDWVQLRKDLNINPDKRSATADPLSTGIQEFLPDSDIFVEEVAVSGEVPPDVASVDGGKALLAGAALVAPVVAAPGLTPIPQ